MKSLILLTAVLIADCLAAQEKHDYTWLMGYGSNNPANHFGGTKIDFNKDTAEFSFFNLPYHFGFDVPCSISDEDGNLQFYANGCRIMNYQHEMIENGDDLSPGWYQPIECEQFSYGYDGYQNFMILPWPGRPSHYLYFHYSIESDFYTATTYYSEIDMNANSGLGKVIKKNQILWELDTIGDSVSAVRHGNGRDWWVVIPEHLGSIFRFYLITPDTIEGPYTQNWNIQEANHVVSGLNTVFSPNGQKFVRMTYSSPPSMFIYDFDRCSGQLSNPVRIDVDLPDTVTYAPWIAISPNSRYLYLQLAQTRLYQYDLEALDIETSAQFIGEYDGFKSEDGFPTTFHAMALAPNNKIYMSLANGTHFLHTIHAPDLPGIACDFRQHDVDLPTSNKFFLPNFPNYRLYDLPGSPCDTLGINTPVAAKELGASQVPDMALTPNPAAESLTIGLQNAAIGRISIADMTGRIWFSTTKTAGQSTFEVNTGHLPAGIYVVSFQSEAGYFVTRKLVVQH
jgi:hypothetical protein